jgi:hypothetical protein
MVHHGQALTSELAGWCWPELVLGGRKPSWWQLKSQARAAKSIGSPACQASGARMAVVAAGRVYGKNPSEIESRQLNKTRHF